MNFKKSIIASTLGCAAISFPLFFAACGDDKSSSANEDEIADDTGFTLEELEELGIGIYESADDLKKEKCGDGNEFETVYVKADSSFYVCYEGEWGNDFSAEPDILESKDDLGECNEENDGQMFRVPRDTIYDTYACENGEWISDFGGSSGEPVDPKKVVVGELKDERDGKTYKTVKIGHQTWMAENLNYKTDNSYCYEGKAENCEKYGRLYIATSGTCPDGWKIPTKKSWEILLATTFDFYTATTPISIKTTDPFEAIMFESFMGLNNDPYGFNILPTGRGIGVTGVSKYKQPGYAFFWTSTKWKSKLLYISFRSKTSGLLAHPGTISMALSIRCIKK